MPIKKVEASDIMPTTAACFASHMGAWAIEPGFMQSAVQAVKSGLWRNVGTRSAEDPSGDKLVLSGEKISYAVKSGVAILNIQGVMQKGSSKFGGASTANLRQALRAAAIDADVGAIFLVIDSPGGTVAGTQSLADDIKNINSKIPVYAHVEDLGASAAYWVASQARSVSATKGSMVGSLGVYSVLVDTSGAAEAEGVKVHVVSTGEFKGSGIDGTPVTDAILTDRQRLTDGQNAEFMGAVGAGRNIGKVDVKKLFDGRVHLASEAKDIGLIDSIMSTDAAFKQATIAAKATFSQRELGNNRLRMARVNTGR